MDSSAARGRAASDVRGPLAGLAVFWRGIALCLSGDGYRTYLLGLVGVTALVGTGLNVLMGLAGQISIGHVGFFAIGGYVTAILTKDLGMSFWPALAAAGALAAWWGARSRCPPCACRGPISRW